MSTPDQTPAVKPGFFTRTAERLDRQSNLVKLGCLPAGLIAGAIVLGWVVMQAFFGGGGFLGGNTERTNAISVHEDAATTLSAALETDTQADTDLTDSLVKAAVYDVKIREVVEATDGLVDADARTNLDATRTTLAETAADVANTQGLDPATGKAIEPVPVSTPPTLDPEATNDGIRASTAELKKLTNDSEADLDGVTGLAKDLDAAFAAVEEAISAVTDSVADSGQKHLDGTPAAGEAERDALQAAIDATTGEATDPLTALTGVTDYVDAANAATESQATADAAAKAAAQQKSNSGSSTPTHTATPTHTPTPTPTATHPPGWYPVKVVPGHTECTGTGGEQTVSYGSTLTPPMDNTGYETWEVHGGWKIHWDCAPSSSH